MPTTPAATERTPDDPTVPGTPETTRAGADGEGTAPERSRRRLGAADAARVATFAALIGALGLPGMITPFGNAVPITLQTLGVMLAGAILGARRGAAAVLVFLALVAVGLPLLAGGRGGLGVFVGPSAGYLVGFVAGAFVVGLLVDRMTRVTFWRVLGAAALGGMLVIYAFGIPVQALVTGLPLSATAVGALAYLPGDLLKAVATASVTVGVVRAYPAVSPAARRAARRTT